MWRCRVLGPQSQLAVAEGFEVAVLMCGHGGWLARSGCRQHRLRATRHHFTRKGGTFWGVSFGPKGLLPIGGAWRRRNGPSQTAPCLNS